MSELLRRWLHDDVGITHPVDTFEESFASGFLFGEVLARCNLQPDFEQFADKNTPDARINNFTRLQPTLAKLGVQLDTRTVTAIVREEKGIAARLVYMLKMSLDAVVRDVQTSKLSGRLARTVTVETRPSVAILEGMKGRGGPRAAFEASTSRIFEDNVRKGATNPNALLEAAHLARYTDEAYRQEAGVMGDHLADRSKTLSLQANRRATQLGTFSAQREAKAAATAGAYANHAENMERAREVERRELGTELALQEKHRLRGVAAVHTARADAVGGIDAFEANLRRLGAGTTAELVPADITPLTGRDPAAHLAALQRSLPDARVLARAGEVYLARMKDTKKEETAARRERERRRHKLLVDQAKSGAAAESRKRQDDLLATLSARSQQETRVAARLRALEGERDTMRGHRSMRDVRYQEQRAADYAAALRREAELAAEGRATYHAAAEEEAAEFAAGNERRELERATAVEAFARKMVFAVASLAGRCAEYREATDALVPRKEYREWVALVVAGVALPGALPETEEEVAEDPVEVTTLDQATCADYIKGTGDWGLLPAPAAAPAEGGVADDTPAAAAAAVPDSAPAPPAAAVAEPGSTAIAPNAALGSAVFDLSVSTLPVPVPPTLPDLAYTIRVAVTGMPFAGKSTLVSALVEARGLSVICPEAVLKEAQEEAAAWDAAEAERVTRVEAALTHEVGDGGAPVGAPVEQAAPAAAEREGTTATPEEVAAAAATDAMPAPRSRKVALGAAAAAAAVAGSPVDVDVVAALIALAVGALAPPPAPLAAAAEGDDQVAAAATADAAAAAAVAAAAARPLGFVIDGFPSTAAEAMALERALTGLDTARADCIRRRCSVVAPPAPQELTAHADPSYVSGLDAVVVLELPDIEPATLRALGRRVDHETGRVFHLDFDPPPTNEPGLIERLEHLVAPEEARVKERLTAWNLGRGDVEAWTARFDGLRVALDATPVKEEVATAAAAVVERIIAAKDAAAAVKEAADAAAVAAATAQAAAAAVATARAAVAAAAEQLLTLRKAEIEARELLAAAGEGEDAAASALLAEKASEAVAAELVKAKEAANTAASQSAATRTAAAEAAAAVEAARTRAGSAEAVAESRATAAAACQVAVAAGAQAAAAAAAASEAEAAVGELVAKAEAAAATALCAEGELEPEAAGTAAGAPTAPTAPTGAAAVTTPPARLVPLPPPLADALYSQWTTTESAYVEGLRRCFALLRQERAMGLAHFVDVKSAFTHFLRRPDGKMTTVRAFQSAFNDVDMDHRRDPRTKGELLVRADELRDALWDVCDAKLEEAVEERGKIVADSWVSDHAAVAAGHYTAVVQLELDRFAATHAMLTDYYAARRGEALDEGGPAGVTPPPDVVRGGDGAEPGPLPVPDPESPETPAWLAPLCDVAPPLAAAVLAALQYVASPLDAGTAGAGGTGGDGNEEEGMGGAGEARASLAEVKAAMSTERATLEARLRRVAERSVTHVHELGNIADLAHQRLEQWLRARYHGECGAAAALAEEVRIAVDEARELEQDLALEEEDLVVLEDERAVPSNPPMPPAPPVEPAPAPGVFSGAQFLGLCAALAEAAPSGVMTAAACGAVVASCGADGGGAGVPVAFAVAPAPILAAAARLFEVPGSPYVEWRSLVASLLAAMYPALLAATAAELASAAAQLAAPAAAGKRIFAAARKLWFLPATSPDQVNISALVMQGLAEAFGGPGEGGDAPVDATMMAMHLCVSATAEAGVGKALEVATLLAAVVGAGGGDPVAMATATALGPMSAAAIELLGAKDLEGKSAEVPALAAAAAEGGGIGGDAGASPLLGAAVGKWFGRYLVKDAYAVVRV